MTRTLAVTAMRNEGPFILEWVAWQRMLGFERILVLYNDCTDHSPELLALLDAAGWIDAQPYSLIDGKPPKYAAHEVARAHPLVAECDWMFLCDVDEFLTPAAPLWTVDDLLSGVEDRAAVMAIHWKCFGDGGFDQWQDGLTHRMLTRAAPTATPANTFFKTAVYKPTRFERFGAHSPRKFSGDWGTPPNVTIDSAGRQISSFDPAENAKQATHPDWVTHARAQVNHYIIRNAESFAFKKGRPSASAGKDRYTEAFAEKFNRNDELDLSALRFSTRFDAWFDQIRALPGARRLHHLCCVDYLTEMLTKAGQDPDADPRIAFHQAQAQA